MKKVVIGVALIILVGAGFLAIRHLDRRVARSASQVTYPEVASGSAYTPGTYSGTINTADGRSRTYVIHIPTGYSSSKQYPLVLLFHGGAGTGSKIFEQTSFPAKADQEGFIVVAPDGIRHNWNDGRGTTDAELAGVDDVSFIRQLIKDLSSKLPVDQRRIYATGASNGGFFTERLGCELSDVLAAIGPDVGPMPTNLAPKCNPVRAIPVIGIQGAADPGIPIEGGTMQGRGDGGEVLSAVDTMQLWAGKSGCNPKPSVVHQAPIVDDGTSVDQYSFSGCTGGAAVVWYIVAGMGHAWPPESTKTSPASHNINATDVIWSFFVANHKNS